MIPGVTTPEIVLLVANCVYATSYVVTRIVLDDVGPATLAFARLAVAGLALVPLIATRAAGSGMSPGDRRAVAAMGVIGFAAAYALSNWGLARSTATNAALLIAVEPIALVVLSPLLLGERLRGRERLAAAAAIVGAVLVVVNGVPGLTREVAPHWRGDALLVLAGVAYASYSLLGRDVLARHPAGRVTAWSILWGAAAVLPLAALEWAGGSRPRWTLGAVLGTLYLGLVITALGYLAWNYALERVPAPRAAIFLNLQPVAGAGLGAAWLGEPLTIFTVAGGALVIAGLSLAVRPRGAG
jgi:drug/metabolite transporter (DMT)-like permease